MMELWTAATPNGWKVNIMVEELIEAGIEMPEMKIRSINLSKGEQFTDEFTEKIQTKRYRCLSMTRDLLWRVARFFST